MARCAAAAAPWPASRPRARPTTSACATGFRLLAQPEPDRFAVDRRVPRRGTRSRRRSGASWPRRSTEGRACRDRRPRPIPQLFGHDAAEAHHAPRPDSAAACRMPGCCAVPPASARRRSPTASRAVSWPAPTMSGAAADPAHAVFRMVANRAHPDLRILKRRAQSRRPASCASDIPSIRCATPRWPCTRPRRAAAARC